MSRVLLFRLQEGKIRVLEEAVESWKRDHEDAVLALDVEELIVGCLSTWEDIRRAWLRTRRLAILNRLSDLEEAGTTMLDLLDRCLHRLVEVANLAEGAVRDTGHAIDGREDLSEATREIRELRVHVSKTWPWQRRPVLPLNGTMAEESRSTRARGESQDVTDILVSLQANAALRRE